MVNGSIAWEWRIIREQYLRNVGQRLLFSIEA